MSTFNLTRVGFVIHAGSDHKRHSREYRPFISATAVVQGLRLRCNKEIAMTSLPRAAGALMHKTVLETRVGDLIVAITDETHRQVRDEKIAYELVAYILADLTKNCRRAH